MLFIRGHVVLRSSLFAADTAPSKQVTLGFIGLGAQGSGLLGNCLGRNDFRVLAACDVDTTRRNLAKQSVEGRYAKDIKSGGYKGCDAYGDYREMLARKDIDAVVIATPDHWHAGTSIAAAKAGKEIYCEKPMAHTLLEGRQVRRKAAGFNNLMEPSPADAWKSPCAGGVARPAWLIMAR